jgi:vacuolar-type H+-ATPase subunit H
MTLTRTQMHERAGSLSGEIKAAREAQSECKRALEDQERLVTIAVQAVVRADARVEELLAERAELAQDMAKAILQVGEAPVADEQAPNVPIELRTDLLPEDRLA